MNLTKLTNLLNYLFQEYLRTRDIHYIRIYDYLKFMHEYRNMDTYFYNYVGISLTRKGDNTFLSESNIEKMNNYLHEWKNILFKELPSLGVLQKFVDYGLIESSVVEFIKCTYPYEEESCIADHMIAFFNDDIKISMPEGDKTLSPSNIEKMDKFIPEWRIILENRPYLYNDILHVFANYGLFEI